MTEAGQLVPDPEDDIVSATLVTRGGQVLHDAKPSARNTEPTENKEIA
jgi:NAD(P) transhydrogenase subunit alpha